MNLLRLSKQLMKLHDEIDKNPLAHAAFSPPQLRYLKCEAKIFLLRGGNQVGKSFVGAAELIYRCLGNHPYKETTTPPIQAWVICHSWSQSQTVQKRIWDLVPKNELCEDMEYVEGKGFRGSGAPVIRFRNGSIAKIKTTQQTGGKKGTVALASASCDYVWLDEPPPASVFSELVARVLRKRGQIGITMTPVGVPVDFLKKMVDKKQIVDIHAPLTEENVTLEGCKTPLLLSHEIKQVSDSYMEFDRDCRIQGSWEGFTPMGVIFADFNDSMITDQFPKGNFKFSVGIDHGSQDGAQFAVLVGVKYPDKNKKIDENNDFHLVILDEYSSGAAKAEIHARGILQMLKRNRLETKHITRWTGDRPHRGDKYGGRMSNKMLRAAFEHVLNYSQVF